jgi:hypothetical protein
MNNEDKQFSLADDLCFIHIYPVKKEIHPSYDNSPKVRETGDKESA